MFKKMYIVCLLFLFSACGVVVSKVIPFQDLPKPQGKYVIGTMIETWEDFNRKEWFTENDLNDNRRIVVQFWYPAEYGIGEYSPYMDQWERRLGPISEQVEVNKAFIHSIKDVKTNSYLNAKMKIMEHKMPLIIFSHGLGGMRMQNTIQMEALASEGYFVLAIDHSYDANITLFDDGTSADFRSAAEDEMTVEEFWDLRIPQINTRSDDVIFVLNQIESFIDSKNEFWNSIDMDRIGVMGHSFGGATAIISSVRDDRLDACIALDGWIVPIESSYIQNGMKVPLLYVGRPKWDSPINYAKLDSLIDSSSNLVTKLILPDTKHFDFSDTPQFSPFSKTMGISGKMPAEAIKDTLNLRMLDFFNKHLYLN